MKQMLNFGDKSISSAIPDTPIVEEEINFIRQMYNISNSTGSYFTLNVLKLHFSPSTRFPQKPLQFHGNLGAEIAYIRQKYSNGTATSWPGTN
jgi:uncharacterized protein YxjI